MLAAIYERGGAAREVLRVEERERPEPAEGEVRVRLRVSGVNPTDWKRRLRGGPPAGAFQVPNMDGAGVVDAVGAGVDPGRVGERCWVLFAAYERPWGTAAQWTVVPADHAVPMPEGASDDLGASLGIPALTAHRCLFADGPLAGRTVLVAGGAGAVGHYAIELARWRGARVVATASSTEKAELARAAGAEAVVDYRETDAAARVREAAPEGVDRVVEVALDRNLALDVAVCAPHAVISSYTDGEPDRLQAGQLMARNLVLRFVLVYTMPGNALRTAIQEVSEALRQGALTELPVHRFPLERIAEAHEAVESGAVGKVLVDIP